MLILSRKNSQFIYTAVQSIYWLIYGLMFAFAAVYLQGRGYSSSATGAVLGISYALSALLQPAIARLFSRRGIPAERGLCAAYCIIALLSLALLLLPLPDSCAALLVVPIFALESAMNPTVTALARRWTDMGCPVDYGASRGIGSLLYAGMTAGMGLLLQRISPRLIPAFYLAALLVSILILARLRVPGEPVSAEEIAPEHSSASAVPGLAPFLIGIGCIALGHTLVDNFMLQIMQNIGGGSAQLGVAVSIASLAEVPAMLLYTRMGRRFGDHRLVIFAAWAWFLKNLLIFFSRSPAAVYAAEILQFFSYGIYVPASAAYINRIFPPRERLRGQSLGGSAYAIGSVAATFGGGLLIDILGVPGTLLIIAAITLTGAILFSLSVKGSTLRQENA